jgi:hypothetical protein
MRTFLGSRSFVCRLPAPSLPNIMARLCGCSSFAFFAKDEQPAACELLFDGDGRHLDLRSANQPGDLDRCPSGFRVGHKLFVDLVHLGYIVKAADE